MRVNQRSFGSRRRVQRGAFTLLEVLVVVAIIVMLAGVGVYYGLQRYEEAKYDRARADVKALSQQVEIYKLKNGDYPATMDQLTVAQPSGGGALVPPDQIRDPWGNIYQIDPDGANNGGNRADVYTVGPNGQTIGNWGTSVTP